MRVRSLRDQELEDVDKRLDNDAIQEFFGKFHLLFLREIGVVLVEVRLVGKVVKHVLVGQFVHPLVRSVDERLLVDFVGDVGQHFIVLGCEGLNVDEERGLAVLVKSVDGLFGGRLVFNQ